MTGLLFEGPGTAVRVRADYGEGRSLDLNVEECLLVAPADEQDLVLTVGDGMAVARMTLAVFRSVLHRAGPEIAAEMLAYVADGLAEEMLHMLNEPKFDA